MTTLIIATRNPHKIQEIRALLGHAFEYRSLADFPGAPAVIEDADTFASNAAKKALEIAAWLAPRLSGHDPQISNPKRNVFWTSLPRTRSRILRHTKSS